MPMGMGNQFGRMGSQVKHASVSGAFPVTSGQNLLLRAQDVVLSDGTGIATWSDTSGSGNDLTQATGASQPTIALSGGNDAKPFVVFPTDSARTIASTSYSVNAQAQSVLLVLDFTSLNTTQYVLTLGGGITLVFMHDVGILKRYDGGFTNVTLTQVPSGKRVAILITLGTGANKIYVDASTNVQSLSAEGAATITGIQLSGGGPVRAKIYEMRGWNRELSSGEAAQILDTWAPATYGTGSAATAPSGRVIFDGDSITEGLGATKARNWPYYLNPGNGWLGYNYGVQGALWANLITNQSITNTFANGTNWLFAYAGTNDSGGGRTAAQIETDFQTYMNAAVAAGFSKSKIAAFTLSTAVSGSAGDTFNTWLRANFATYAGFLVDLAADPTLGITGSTKNTPALWADGAHYNDAGYVAMATFVRSSIGSPPF